MRKIFAYKDLDKRLATFRFALKCLQKKIKKARSLSPKIKGRAISYQ